MHKWHFSEITFRRQLFKKLEERNSSINNAQTRWNFLKKKITPSDGEGDTTEENNNSRPDASEEEQVIGSSSYIQSIAKAANNTSSTVNA